MFLGLDLGTSELKALLLSDQHQVIATARAPLTVQRPRPLWSEQDPAAWWAPGRGDGPPPPSLEGSPAQATTAPAPERVEVAVPPAPEIPSPLPVVTAPD